MRPSRPSQVSFSSIPLADPSPFPSARGHNPQVGQLALFHNLNSGCAECQESQAQSHKERPRGQGFDRVHGHSVSEVVWADNHLSGRFKGVILPLCAHPERWGDIPFGDILQGDVLRGDTPANLIWGKGTRGVPLGSVPFGSVPSGDVPVFVFFCLHLRREM